MIRLIVVGRLTLNVTTPFLRLVVLSSIKRKRDKKVSFSSHPSKYWQQYHSQRPGC